MTTRSSVCCNESFDSDTRSVSPSPDLVADVRRRIKRRKAKRLAAVGGSAAAICTVAVAITAERSRRSGRARTRGGRTGRTVDVDSIQYPIQ